MSNEKQKSIMPTDAEIERMALEEYPAVPVVNPNNDTHVEDLNEELREVYKYGYVNACEHMNSEVEAIAKEVAVAFFRWMQDDIGRGMLNRGHQIEGAYNVFINGGEA